MTDQEFRKSTTPIGKRKRIASHAANEDAHTFRQQYDVILVNKQTTLHKHPSLTTRRPRGGHHPIRIVLDSEHTIPITNTILQDQLQKERREVHVHRHY